LDEERTLTTADRSRRFGSGWSTGSGACIRINAGQELCTGTEMGKSSRRRCRRETHGSLEAAEGTRTAGAGGGSAAAKAARVAQALADLRTREETGQGG
jgi:hypothetical protein